MKFKDLKVGQWFDFAKQMPFSGSPTGPFKKTGKRTYIYHHPHGWLETNVGTISVEVMERERPDDAPDELVDIAIDFNSEMNGYVSSIQSYRVRDGEPKNRECVPSYFSADNRSKHEAMLEAVREAKEEAESLVSNPLSAEKVIIFLEGDEYLIALPHNGKAKVTAGVGNPRHPLNRQKSA